MKKIKLALLILGISVFAGCSGDVVEDVGVNKETTEAKLTVTAIDYITGEAIDGVEITLSSLQPVLTKDGIATFDDVRIGTHTLKAKKEGYATIDWPVRIERNEITVNETKGEITFTAKGNSISVPLLPESSNLYGYIYYTNTKGDIVPAKDVTVYIDFPFGIFEKQLFIDTTDANGKYSFNSLPSGGIRGTIRAVAPETGLDGIKFETIQFSSEPLLVGDIYNGVKNFTQAYNKAVFEASYSSTVAKTAPIVITFTDAIDLNYPNYIIGETIRVYPSDATIKVEGNKVTITPFNNEWKPDTQNPNTIYVFFDELKSVSGIPFDDDITISLGSINLSGASVEGIEIISQEKFNYNAKQVDLRWKTVEGATSYDIYRKGDIDSSYVFVKNVPAIEGADLGYENGVSLESRLDGRTVSFAVRAKNNTSISLLDTTKAFTIHDELPPLLAQDPETPPGCLVFNEPIDKKTLTITPASGYIVEDTNANKICVEFYPYPAVTVPTDINYTISGIQDQFGNKFNTTGSGTITLTQEP